MRPTDRRSRPDRAPVKNDAASLEAQSPKATSRTTIQAWSGPLPPPASLRAFEDCVPGAARLILEEFQAEAAHRRALELRQAALVARETHIGQALAITFALGALGVTAYAVSAHAEWIGSIVGGGVILSGIIAFLRGKVSQPPVPVAGSDDTDEQPKLKGNR